MDVEKQNRTGNKKFNKLYLVGIIVFCLLLGFIGQSGWADDSSACLMDTPAPDAILSATSKAQYALKKPIDESLKALYGSASESLSTWLTNPSASQRMIFSSMTGDAAAYQPAPIIETTVMHVNSNNLAETNSILISGEIDDAVPIVMPAQYCIPASFAIWSAHDHAPQPTHRVRLTMPYDDYFFGVSRDDRFLYDDIKYFTVADQSQCTSSHFNQSSNYTHMDGETEFFLEPLDDDQAYCLQVTAYRIQGLHYRRIETVIKRTFYLKPTTTTSHAAVNLATPARTVARGHQNYDVVTGDRQPATADSAVYAQARQHLLSQLQVVTRQTSAGLDFKIFKPHTLYPDRGEPDPDAPGRFRSLPTGRSISYHVNRVNVGVAKRVEDCTFANFDAIEQTEHQLIADTVDLDIIEADENFWSKKFRHLYRKPVPEIPALFYNNIWYRLPVKATDLNSRYCFKVRAHIRLDVDPAQVDQSIYYQPELLFVMSRNLGVVSNTVED